MPDVGSSFSDDGGLEDEEELFEVRVNHFHVNGLKSFYMGKPNESFVCDVLTALEGGDVFVSFECFVCFVCYFIF